MSRLLAEIGSVHDGSFGNAIKLIEAVRFRTHLAGTETLRNAADVTWDTLRGPQVARLAFPPLSALRSRCRWHGLT
jgi:hypothetical protein